MPGDPEFDVEAVRCSYEAFNRRDFEQAMSLHDDGIEWVDPPVLPDAGSYRGSAEIKVGWERFAESWEHYRFEPLEMIPNGDRLFAAVRMTGRGRGSGAEVTIDYFQVWFFRDGRVIRQLGLVNRAEALAAAGLDP